MKHSTVHRHQGYRVRSRSVPCTATECTGYTHRSTVTLRWSEGFCPCFIGPTADRLCNGLKVRTPTFCIFLFLALIFSAQLHAQLPNTDLQTIYPPFGKAGDTVKVYLSGKNLEEIDTLRFNDPRISAAPETTPADEVYPEPQAIKNRFIVTIPEDISPGIYEVRALGYHGLSTARPFQVLPEDINHRLEEATHDSPEKALPVVPGDSVYGTITSRQVEWFKLNAGKGQRYFMTMWCERLDSKLDPQIRVFDSKARELEHAGDHFDRDPFLDFTAPEDGEYTIAVADNLYRGGGNTHFYRFAIHQKPHIDFIWPPAGIPGTKQKFTIYGRNLPSCKPVKDFEIDGKAIEFIEAEIELPKEPTVPQGFSYETPRRAMLPALLYSINHSNTGTIGFATAPIIFEDAKAEIQTVPVPSEIAGKFDAPGDFDTYHFTAGKDKTYWIEVYSDRLGVSSDTVIIVKKVAADGTKKRIAENDDPATYFRADNRDATHLDTNDSAISFTAKEAGDFEVLLLNQSSSGSVEHIYRLAIREAVHNFQLAVGTEDLVTATNGRAGYPVSPLLRKNGTVAWRVAAFRQDGFDGDITVTAEGLPAGVTAKPLVLHSGNKGGFLSLKASADVKTWSGPIRIVGRATSGDRKISRTARNASLVWGEIFADSRRVRTRFDIETVLSVTDEELSPCYLELANSDPLTVELNQVLEIPVKVTDHEEIRKGNLTVMPYGFPGMLRSEPTVTIAEGKSEGILKVSFKPTGNFKVAAGKYDFVLQGTGIARHRTNVSAVAEAEQEVNRLRKLKSETTSEAVLKKVDMALKNAEKAKAEAEKLAKEKDTKFATCSQTITVTVTEPVAKK